MMTNKIIYTRKIAMKLVEMGHVPAGTMPNPSKPEFLCWIFEITPKFEKDLQTVLGEASPRNRTVSVKVTDAGISQRDML